MSNVIWSGQLISVAEMTKRLPSLSDELKRARRPLTIDTLLTACEQLASRLREDDALRVSLLSLIDGEPDKHAVLEELAVFLGRESLEEKLLRELSNGDAARSPFRLERIDARKSIFEMWAPLGFLVHIAPTNATNVPFLSVLEGLLTGNINFLKVGGEDTGYAATCLRALVECDTTESIAPYVYAAPISSKKRDLLKLVMAEADGVAVWGAEEAITGVRELAPHQARVIEWGPKISFAFIDESRLKETSFLKALAEDCCRFEQQACSSPQVIYVDTDDSKTLLAFAEHFSQVFDSVSLNFPVAREPYLMEQAELTKVETLARLETCFDDKNTLKVIKGKNWRVFVDASPVLKASPLFRTVWIKGLPKKDLRRVLRPMRHYLQTAGVVAKPRAMADLSRELFACGVLRVTSVGEMLAGYSGEPHDGVYSLQRYCRRVGVRLTDADAVAVDGISALDELGETPKSFIPDVPLMTKDMFSGRIVDEKQSDLFFKSGGSSGEPKLSVFTYEDYHRQMKVAAEGLIAAGLQPDRDRCMNLFFSGGLYGGFISFFSILEAVNAVQFPMAAHLDFAVVAKEIVRGKVNVVLGMPSYLLRLFEEQKDLLAKYGGIEKVFYGGEHFSEAQRSWLRETFGVKAIRSAAYGGNDTGPMGYQCTSCEGSEHHLYDRLHSLEIIKIDRDEPVAAGETGRMVFTAKVRKGQKIERYEVGDLGAWTSDSEKCACGRSSAKFDLHGRYGDLFRAAGMFFNYRKFTKLIPREIQIVLEKSTYDKITLRYSADADWPETRVRQVCLENYSELREGAVDERTLEFFCESVPASKLERQPGSGKLKAIVDKRA